jgi:hypothetical protein
VVCELYRSALFGVRPVAARIPFAVVEFRNSPQASYLCGFIGMFSYYIAVSKLFEEFGLLSLLIL